MKELTIELTNYCPHGCKFCSSNTVTGYLGAMYIPISIVERALNVEGKFDRIILSGGEPLAHPEFYTILEMCRAKAHDVIVYTNALTHIAVLNFLPSPARRGATVWLAHEWPPSESRPPDPWSSAHRLYQVHA